MGALVMVWQRPQQGRTVALAPKDGGREQQLDRAGPRLGLGKGLDLGVFFHRGVVGHQRVDGAIGQRGGQRVAVGLLAQRRNQAGAAVEVADVVLRSAAAS